MNLCNDPTSGQNLAVRQSRYAFLFILLAMSRSVASISDTETLCRTDTKSKLCVELKKLVLPNSLREILSPDGNKLRILLTNDWTLPGPVTIIDYVSSDVLYTSSPETMIQHASVFNGGELLILTEINGTTWILSTKSWEVQHTLLVSTGRYGPTIPEPIPGRQELIIVPRDQPSHLALYSLVDNKVSSYFNIPTTFQSDYLEEINTINFWNDSQSMSVELDHGICVWHLPNPKSKSSSGNSIPVHVGICHPKEHFPFGDGAESYVSILLFDED